MTDCTTTSMSKLVSIVENMCIDTASTDDQTLNEEIYAWYCERIDRCIADDCKEAISAYLRKLLKDTRANDITKSYIIVYANKGGN